MPDTPRIRAQPTPIITDANDTGATLSDANWADSKYITAYLRQSQRGFMRLPILSPYHTLISAAIVCPTCILFPIRCTWLNGDS